MEFERSDDGKKAIVRFLDDEKDYYSILDKFEKLGNKIYDEMGYTFTINVTDRELTYVVRDSEIIDSSSKEADFTYFVKRDEALEAIKKLRPNLEEWTEIWSLINSMYPIDKFPDEIPRSASINFIYNNFLGPKTEN